MEFSSFKVAQIIRLDCLFFRSARLGSARGEKWQRRPEVGLILRYPNGGSLNSVCFNQINLLCRRLSLAEFNFIYRGGGRLGGHGGCRGGGRRCCRRA